MHHKDIKREIKNQLKKQFPNWKRLSKKEKREIAKAVLKEVVDNYDFRQDATAPEHELLGVEKQVFTPRIMDLNRMAKFIKSHYSGQMFKIRDFSDKLRYIKDEEPKLIDELLDNGIIAKIQ
ncbi:hypothetical protein QUF75_18130 [Desulfococcaceae bacterium HSG7]|nr:hypothetical protein [Desulfococcaceae bacterium HSG7]